MRPALYDAAVAPVSPFAGFTKVCDGSPKTPNPSSSYLVTTSTIATPTPSSSTPSAAACNPAPPHPISHCESPSNSLQVRHIPPHSRASLHHISHLLLGKHAHMGSLRLRCFTPRTTAANVSISLYTNELVHKISHATETNSNFALSVLLLVPPHPQVSHSTQSSSLERTLELTPLQHLTRHASPHSCIYSEVWHPWDPLLLKLGLGTPGDHAVSATATSCALKL